MMAQDWIGNSNIEASVLIKQLDDVGWIIVPGWITDEEVHRQRTAMETVPVLRQHSPGHAPNGLTVRAHNLLGKTRSCDHLATDPRLLALVKGHLRDTIQFSICTLMDILPGEAAQKLHQDDAMYHLPYPHIPLTVNTVITLDNFTAENGATRIVPHSKDWENPINQELGEKKHLPAVCPAGSLVAWSGSTWHGGGANQTSTPRLALNFHYCRSWLKPQESQLLGVDQAEVLNMDSEFQKLLGYEGSVAMRNPIEVIADKAAGKKHPWVHPQATVPGVTKAGDKLPPDQHGKRQITEGPKAGQTHV